MVRLVGVDASLCIGSIGVARGFKIMPRIRSTNAHVARIDFGLWISKEIGRQAARVALGCARSRGLKAVLVRGADRRLSTLRVELPISQGAFAREYLSLTVGICLAMRQSYLAHRVHKAVDRGSHR